MAVYEPTIQTIRTWVADTLGLSDPNNEVIPVAEGVDQGPRPAPRPYYTVEFTQPGVPIGQRETIYDTDLGEIRTQTPFRGTIRISGYGADCYEGLMELIVAHEDLFDPISLVPLTGVIRTAELREKESRIEPKGVVDFEAYFFVETIPGEGAAYVEGTNVDLDFTATPDEIEVPTDYLEAAVGVTVAPVEVDAGAVIEVPAVGTDPKSLASLVGYLDARDLSLADGDPVSSWPSGVSGGTDATQVATASQPRYRAGGFGTGTGPTVDLDGADDFLDWNIALAQNTYTIQTLVKFDGTTTRWLAFSGQIVLIAASGGGLTILDNGTFRSTNVAIYPGSPLVLTVRFNGAPDGTFDVFVDGDEVLTGVTYNPANLTSPGYIGRRLASNAFNMDGEFGALAIYDEALSDANIADTSAYLLDQWNVADDFDPTAYGSAISYHTARLKDWPDGDGDRVTYIQGGGPDHRGIEAPGPSAPGVYREVGPSFELGIGDYYGATSKVPWDVLHNTPEGTIVARFSLANVNSGLLLPIFTSHQAIAGEHGVFLGVDDRLARDNDLRFWLARGDSGSFVYNGTGAGLSVAADEIVTVVAAWDATSVELYKGSTQIFTENAQSGSFTVGTSDDLPAWFYQSGAPNFAGNWTDMVIFSDKLSPASIATLVADLEAQYV